MRCTRLCARTTTGFTLVELLVVPVAIIAPSWRVAILLPAVQQARRSGSSVPVLKSNLKQIGIALHSYNEALEDPPRGLLARAPRSRGASWCTCFRTRRSRRSTTRSASRRSSIVARADRTGKDRSATNSPPATSALPTRTPGSAPVARLCQELRGVLQPRPHAKKGPGEHRRLVRLFAEPAVRSPWGDTSPNSAPGSSSFARSRFSTAFKHVLRRPLERDLLRRRRGRSARGM